ncbi:DUF3021 domain-containing protein [Rummeliibacillus pycnus]|uniref:DUF3021 domain-containing protein n=1 Tax=Rummeliibacillus pycnus TaxID=101070 RepID=UPI003D2660E7
MRRFGLLQSGLIGFLISLSTSYCMVTLDVLNTNATITGHDLLEQVFVAAILGIAIGICTMIYQIEQLSFFVQIIIHFILVTICVGVAGYFGHWFDFNNIWSFVNVFISELIIYTIVWFFFYTKAKHDIREMNELLQKRQEM